MTPIRLLLVDDHYLFREGIGRLLTSEPDFEVVTDCGTVSDARAIVEQCWTDVVLLDFDLGGADGLGLTGAIWRTGKGFCSAAVLAGHLQHEQPDRQAREQTAAVRIGVDLCRR